jgi:hypothetical protein
MIVPVAALAMLASGCASYTWYRADTPSDVAARDEADCYDVARNAINQAQLSAFPRIYGPARPSSPFWWRDPYWSPAEDPLWRAQTEQRLRDECMRGRGYDLQRAPRA